MLFSLTDIYGILGIIIIALTKHSWLRKEVIYLSGYFITAVLLNDYMKIIVALSAIIIIMLRLFGLIKNKI